MRAHLVPDEPPTSSGLAAVLLEHREQLLRFLTARLRDPLEAEDVVQEVAVKLMAAPPGPVGQPVAYIYRTALNLANDRWRSRRRREGREAAWLTDQTHMADGVALDPQPSPEAAADLRQRAERVAAAIERMPPGAARVFRLHKLDGLSHAAVAAHLGISKSAVEKHMAVALRHLLRELR